MIGALRRSAYARPSHDPLHWLLLLAADRVETTAARPSRAIPLVLAVLATLVLVRRR